ncbi:MAG: DUF4125 family protein [Holophagales bacterium]|jgi:hypothetical protein|nr:DUF4125 family protein [Holophagales bacterium]MBK9966767.1 DUF4125 family protein [Holophagales bacterium]
MTLPPIPGPGLLVEEIVQHEWEMMMEMVAGRPELCQERPGTFRTMREITNSVLSPDTLRSYLGELRQARLAGRNLLDEKRALLEKPLPAPRNAFVPRIVAIESAWMAELCERFPFTFRGALSDFARVLECELSMLSDATVTLFYRDVLGAREAGRNLQRERYETFFRRLARGTLEEVEAKERAKVPDAI